MAMYKKMPATRPDDIPSEVEQPLDVPALGRDPIGIRLDHIVKSKLQPRVPVIDAESIGLGPSGIEDREDMGYAPRAMEAELIEPANCYPEGH